jgi:Tol biopolymer transport system component/DNA-binding winged helix-turn-helix (wHTH) protein
MLPVVIAAILNRALVLNQQPGFGPARQVSFGPFAFDETAGELKKHGVSVRLQGQPLQILRMLLRQPGEVLPRDEFQKQLWESSTFVDFEHGLNGAMNRLRQTLGDSAEQPRYIETLAGRGYRFIAPLHETPKPLSLTSKSSAPPDIEPAAPPPPRARAGHRPWVLGMIAAALLIGSAGGYWAVPRPRAEAGQPLRFSVSPPNGFALEAGSSRQTFALSPDGARLAFTAMDASGKGTLFIRDFDGLDSWPLANSVGAYHVFWAPDGRSLFFTVGSSLRRTTLENDSFQVISETPPMMLTGAVMGDDLLISGRTSNYVVPVSGGQAKVTKDIYPWPHVLPDGKRLLYTVFDPRSGHHRIRVVNYGEPETVKDLLEADSRGVYTPSVLHSGTGHILYVRAGNILAHRFDLRSLAVQDEPLPVVSQTYSFFATGAADFSVSNNGTLAYRRYRSQSQLAWVNRRGDVVETVGPANVNVKQGRLSPDGKRIAASIYSADGGVNDMWIIDAETNAARRVIAGRGHVDNPVWAPDSARLAFSRAYDSPPKMFVRGLGEQQADEKLPEDYFQMASDWSRDGRFIAFTNAGSAINSELKGDVWLIDMARGRKVIHLISTPFHEANPAFSPDGRWLAFTSDESGRTELYVQAFEAGEAPRLTGERHLVSRNGAIALRWRSDGKELFFLSSNSRVYAVPIVLYPRPKIGGAVSLFAISLEARSALHSRTGFDVSIDGQRFLIPIVAAPEKSEIVVMKNWEASVGRRQSNHK